MAGYSGTPLPKKLGIKENGIVGLLAAPAGFADLLEPLPAGVKLLSGVAGTRDVAVGFFVERAEFERHLAAMRQAIAPAGGLWIAWPKKASKVPTDMTEDVVREVALPTGLVDNKVCAIDDVWSALRLVIRRELR